MKSHLKTSQLQNRKEVVAVLWFFTSTTVATILSFVWKNFCVWRHCETVWMILICSRFMFFRLHFKHLLAKVHRNDTSLPDPPPHHHTRASRQTWHHWLQTAKCKILLRVLYVLCVYKPIGVLPSAATSPVTAHLWVMQRDIRWRSDSQDTWPLSASLITHNWTICGHAGSPESNMWILAPACHSSWAPQRPQLVWHKVLELHSLDWATSRLMCWSSQGRAAVMTHQASRGAVPTSVSWSCTLKAPPLFIDSAHGNIFPWTNIFKAQEPHSCLSHTNSLLSEKPWFEY